MDKHIAQHAGDPHLTPILASRQDAPQNQWTLDEDLDLISQHVGFGMSSEGAILVAGHPHTHLNRGRTPPTFRLQRLRQFLVTSDDNVALAALFLGSDETRPAQPELQCNPTLPARKLSYDEDTVLTLPPDIAKAAPLPDGAAVRFIARADGLKQPVGSIPETWLLVLPVNAFLLHNARGQPCNMRYEYKLCDVRRDTVVGAIEADVADFLRGKLTGLSAAHDVLEKGQAMQYYDKGCDAVVEVTVIEVHRNDDTPYYTVELPSRQDRETTREWLWHEGEAPPPTARAGTPADEAQQARSHVAWPSRHAECGPPPPRPRLVYRTTTERGAFEYEPVDPTATAQHEDLCNRSRELYVTNLPMTQLPRDALQQQRAFASQGAGNTRPAAPEHNRMLNNITAGDHSKHKEGTRLPTAAADWRKLRNHLKAVEGQPQCVCYNCGMLIYRKDARLPLPLPLPLPVPLPLPLPLPPPPHLPVPLPGSSRRPRPAMSSEPGACSNR